MLSSIPTSNTKVYVFVPLMIPGAKRKSLLKVLEELQDVKFTIISLEKIKNDEMMKNPEFKSEKIDMIARKEFRRQLDQELSQASRYPSSKPHLIYLKKSHPPNAWESTFKIVREANNPNIQVIALVPFMQGELITYRNGAVQVPFTSRFVLDCITKLHIDEKSQEYKRQGDEKTKMVIDFVRYYEGTKFDDEGLKPKGFHGIFVLPYASEDTSNTFISEKVENLLIKALESPIDSIQYDGLLPMITKPQSKKQVEFDYQDLRFVRNSLIQFFAKEGVTLSCLQAKNDAEPSLFDGSNNPLDLSITETTQTEQTEGYLLENSSSVDIPAYIGIFPVKNKIAGLKKYIEKNLDLLSQAFPCDNSQLKFVDDPHITCLRIAGDESKLQTKVYNNFDLGEQVEFEIVGLIVVPHRAVIALCNLDRSNVKIEDRFCCMVMMTGLGKHYLESQTVLEAIFGVDKPLFKNYDGEKYSLGQMRQKVEIIIGKEGSTMYIIGCEESFEVLAETRQSYNDDV